MSHDLRLYYSPGACSMVAHIALEEAGARFEPVRVLIAEGENLRPEYLAIHRHGRIPTLAADRGLISENIAVLNYIADLFSAPGAVPRGDPFAAAQCNQLLGWLASSVHIAFAQVWRGWRFTEDQDLWPRLEAGGRKVLAGQFEEIEAICGDEWIVPGHFTAVETYALTFLRWAKRIGFDIEQYPRWRALNERTLDRPAVTRTLAREGLSPDDFRP